MAELILREEVSLIPGLGATLLPGAKGFVAQQTWRLNASYAPIEVLRALERSSDERQWAAVLESSQRVIAASAPRGFAADWILYRESGGFSADATTAGAGKLRRDPRLSVGGHACGGRSAGRQPGAAAQTDGPRPRPGARLPHQSTRTPSRHAARLRPVSWPRCCRCSVHFKFTDAVQAYRQRIEAESLKDNQHYYSDALTLFGAWLARGPLPLRSTR